MQVNALDPLESCYELCLVKKLKAYIPSLDHTHTHMHTHIHTLTHTHTHSHTLTHICTHSHIHTHTHTHTHTLTQQQRKPIQQLTAVPSQKRLLALVDGTLYLMNMATLELYDTGQRIAKVATMAPISLLPYLTSPPAPSLSLFHPFPFPYIPTVYMFYSLECGVSCVRLPPEAAHFSLKN